MKLIILIFIILIILNSIICEEEEINDNNITTDDAGYDLTKLYKFNCTDPLFDCSGNGICSDDGLKCICNLGYQTFYENFEDYLMNKPWCNYKSKYQTKALLFSIFLSFGSAHFYLGHSFIGFFQLCFFVFVISFNTICVAKLSIKHIKKLNRNQLKNSFNLIIIMIISTALFFFWYIFDLIMIYLNVYKDSNNAKLYSYY